MRLDLFQFQRALEIALKFKNCLEIVLFYRKRFLDSFGKKENNKEFMAQFDRQGSSFDMEDIAKMEKDQLQDEKANNTGRRK